MTTTQTDELTVERLATLARASADLIGRLQAPSGAYPASPTFPVYRFSWLRDGAFIADAMSRAGERASAGRFFQWCAGVIEARADRVAELLAARAAGDAIQEEQYLACRFTLDGADDDSDWWHFQLDGYGTWLWALAAHATRTATSVAPYAEAIRLTVDYLVAFWDEPCFDWWEEHGDRRHTATLAAISGGLAAIARAAGVQPDVAARAGDVAASVRVECLAQRRGDVLVKWQGSGAVDASLLACATPFGLLEPADPVVRATVAQIETRLVRDGGVYRYEADTYFGGGRWVLLAGLLGWHYAEAGRADAAWAQLRWMAGQARGDELPEQVADRLLAPEREQEWIDRWGPSACPLLWSHAMYLTLAVELGLLEAGR